MPRVFPFAGLVFDPALAGPLERVTAPPYDVISDSRRQEFLAASYGIAHVDLAWDEAASAPHGSARSPDRYERAGARLRDWVANGALVPEPTGFHAYEMTVVERGLERRVRGVLCAMELEEWGDRVLPHERTMAGPLEDRLRLLRATRTHLSPVYGTIAGPCPDLAELLDRVMATAPDAQMIDEQGVRHARWRVPSEVPIARWLADEPLLIADGHHRYTTALAFRDELRAGRGRGPWDRLLTLIVDAGSQPLPVHPFHRVQLDGPVPGAGSPVGGPREALAALSDEGLVVALARHGTAGAELSLLKLTGDPPAVRALHREMLDPRVPADALRFTPDPLEALDAVRAGGAVAAYLLPPTTSERIRRAIQGGERLPPKSTYFWPKPRTGMVLMPLDLDAP